MKKGIIFQINGGSFSEIREEFLLILSEEEKKQKFLLDLLLSVDSQLKYLVLRLRTFYTIQKKYLDSQQFEKAAEIRDREGTKIEEDIKKYLSSRYPDVELGDKDGWKERFGYFLD
jgi:hypothetical protein